MQRIKKITVYFLCCLLTCLAVCSALPALHAAASSTVTGYVDATSVRIRSGPSTSTAIVTTVSNVYVTVTGSLQGTDDSYLWYHVIYGSYVGYIRGDFVTITSNPETDADFETQLAAFPEDYKASLRALHALHPGWSFIADPLSMSLDEALDHEVLWFRKEVNMTADGISWRSMGSGYYNWDTGTWNTDNNGSWTGAAREVIAHYMDPRNFLNETEIFTFFRHSYDSSQTAAGVAKMVSGTFLANGYSDSADTAYGGSYINVIMAAAQQSNVNPYILASIIIQEQGVNGSSGMISGTTSYGKYYNFFNVKASGSDVIGSGLTYAQQQGWNTRSASIIGGAVFYGQNYVARGQDTFFYKDFNLNSSSPYVHQYAQNVYDARATGAKLSKSYVNVASAPESLSFRIPVYTSMPAEVCAMPPETSNLANYYFTSMWADGISPAFSMYTKNYTWSVSGNARILLKVPAGASLAGTTEYALSAGSNTVSLTVRAQNGYTNTYTVTVSAAAPCTLNVALLRGDITNDGRTDLRDLIRFKRYLAGQSVSVSTADAEMDGSDGLGAGDLVALRQYLLALAQ